MHRCKSYEANITLHGQRDRHGGSYVSSPQTYLGGIKIEEDSRYINIIPFVSEHVMTEIKRTKNV